MKNFLIKIFFILLGITSFVAIFFTAQLVYFDYVQDFYFALEALGLIVAIWGYYSFEKLEKQKPKEVVKVIYKTIEKTREEKPKEDTQKKEKEIIDKVVKSCIKDLDKYTNDLKSFGDQLFKNLSNALSIVTGMLFLWNKNQEVYYTVDTYAFYREDSYREYKLGEGLIGQVAKDKKTLYIDNVPEGYIQTLSGLGKGTPKYLVVLPIVKNNFTIAVIEFASFSPIPEPAEKILDTLSKKLSELNLSFEQLS